ncbi:MAG TPA: ATP-binding protein [Verrucomicrobiae bacterium]|nr:ATP-binding protein [Verrucomicrobiae bacterium]
MELELQIDREHIVSDVESSQGLLWGGRACSLATLAFGLMGLAGWFFHQPAFRSFGHSGAEMKFNTALCLSLIGCSLLLNFKSGKTSRALSILGSALVLLIALLTLCEYFFSQNFGLDEFVYQDFNLIGTTFAGRMAPQSALTFSLMAAGAFVLNCPIPRLRRTAHWAALGSMIFPAQAIIGYLLGHMTIVGLGPQSAYMAMPTALAFLAGSIALLLRDPDRDLMESLTARTQASSVFRRLLVTSLVLPLALGWFALHIAGGKIHSAEYSVATIAFATTFLFVGLTWFNAARLNAAAHALAQREHRYSQLVENIPDVVFRLDRQFRYLYISPTIEKFSSLPPAQYLGKTIAETGTTLELCERFETACQQALKSFHEQSFEFEFGGRVTLTRIIPVSSDNEGETLLGLTSDITQRKVAEAAFRDTQDRLEATLAATQVATWTWDVPNDRLFADKNLARFFSVSVQDAAGGSIQKYLHAIHAEDRPKVEAAMIETLHNHQSQYEMDYRLVQPDKTVRWVTARGKVERDLHGKPLRFSGVVMDITERQRTEAALSRARIELEQTNQNLEATIAERTARLRETVQELEAFSYSIAHDMRAPLRSMVGFSTLLDEEFGPRFDETGREYLHRLIASATRMDHLIVDILNYSKVVRGELNLDSVDVEKLTLEIIESYPALLQARSGITIASPIPPVIANQAALTQVISNVLGNAVKFVAPGVKPQIRLWAQTPQTSATDTNPVPAGSVRLWFEDNGIGIPKESQPQLFKIFVRLHRPEVYEGTGIGLAIVKRAVERMGGTVGLESEPGHGTRLWVQLRQATEPPTSPVLT